MFEILDGKPEKSKKAVRGSKYPWPDMKPGKMVIVPATVVAKTNNGGKKYISSALSFGRRHGQKFVTQTKSSGEIHIFRTK